MDTLLGLPFHIQLRIFSLIPQNEKACNLRPVSKAFAALLSNPEHKTVRLSNPVPHHAFLWRWGRCSPYLRTMNRKQRLHLLALTASSGVLQNVDVGHDSVSIVYEPSLRSRQTIGTSHPDALEEAAASGHMHICEFLLRKSWRWFSALLGAARGGHRAICEWSLEQAAQWDSFEVVAHLRDAACEAARAGHFEILEWLGQMAWDRGRPSYSQYQYGLMENAIAAVAEGCDLAALQHFYNSCLEEAAAGGGGGAAAADAPAGRAADGQRGEDEPQPLQRLQRLQPQPQAAPQLHSDCMWKMLLAAARSPIPDWRAKVEWCEAVGCKPRSDACYQAAFLPDAVDRLAWLSKRGYRLDASSVLTAACAGNMATLEYLSNRHLLRNLRFPWDSEAVLKAAARGGHLAVVAWLVEALGVDVAQLERPVMDAAAESGNVELLTWLVERGCPLLEFHLEFALESGCEAAVEWMLQRGCVWQDYNSNWKFKRPPYAAAAFRGDLGMMRCLRRLGCPWEQALHPNGARNRVFQDCLWAGFPLEWLQWLVAEGCPVDWGKALEAVCRRLSYNRPDVEAWLREEAQKSGH